MAEKERVYLFADLVETYDQPPAKIRYWLDLLKQEGLIAGRRGAYNRLELSVSEFQAFQSFLKLVVEQGYPATRAAKVLRAELRQGEELSVEELRAAIAAQREEIARLQAALKRRGPPAVPEKQPWWKRVLGFFRGRWWRGGG